KPADIALSRLMQPPPPPPEAIEKPTSAAKLEAATAKPAATAKSLHYLQIESFRVSHGGSRGDVLAEMQDARKFLKSRGIDTAIRDTGKEFILISTTGVVGIKDPDAVQLKTRIEQFGREYRKAGGRYEFKGCFWRSESTLPGKELHQE